MRRHSFGPTRLLPCALALALAPVLLLGQGSPAGAAAEQPESVRADAETVPVRGDGDAADEPSLWVHPTSPSQSLLIGNDKKGALEVYNLDGSLRQRIGTPGVPWGNSDVRQQVTIGGRTRDLVVATNAGLRVFTVDPGSRTLEEVTEANELIEGDRGEGLCLYHSPSSGELSAFVISRKGRVRQFLVNDADKDGLVRADLVREFEVGSEAEGCVVDDASGALYVSEEDLGLWRYGAEPADGAARVLVDTVSEGGHLEPDVEGLTLVDTGGGSGYLIASAQYVQRPTESYFVVYDRRTNAYVKSFRIVDGELADGCHRTDGIAAYAGDLGPAFPQGVFVCQDQGNTEPGSSGAQDFKLTRLDRILPLR